MTINKYVFLVLLLSLIANEVQATIQYVTPSGSGTMSGNSWLNAFSGNSLQTAINNASSGDSIWVACGTYRPTFTTDRSQAFHMRNGISIFGSFEGTEALVSERQFACGPCSILNGNIGNPNISTDNIFTIIVNIGLDNSAILDGFEVSDGYDDRSISSIEAGLGGGVYNGGAGVGGEGGQCSPIFRNCTILNNYAAYGAGMFNNGHNNGNSEPLLINCIIAFNTATIGGGGMDSYEWSNGNVAPTLYNCLFYNNTSYDRAGGMYCWGGRGGNCSPSIINSAFINNTSANIAGGLIVDNSDDLDGLPPFNGTAEIEINNSIFWGNTSAQGPQFYILGTGHFNALYSNIDTVGQTLAHVISGLGTGNIFTNPQFNDINNGRGIDNCWMTADDGTSLLITSPCINSGNSDFMTSPDLSFQERISGVAIDIGPYEFNLPESVFWTGTVGQEWGNFENWNPTRVPDSLQIVNIPGIIASPNQPILNNNSGFCRELIMEENSILQIMGTSLLHIKN